MILAQLEIPCQRFQVHCVLAATEMSEVSTLTLEDLTIALADVNPVH